MLDNWNEKCFSKKCSILLISKVEGAFFSWKNWVHVVTLENLENDSLEKRLILNSANYR